MPEFRTYDLSIVFVRLCRNLNAPEDLRDKCNFRYFRNKGRKNKTNRRHTS
jgi:hypothetical protein